MPTSQRKDSPARHGSTGCPNLVPGSLGQLADVPVTTSEDCVSVEDYVGTDCAYTSQKLGAYLGPQRARVWMAQGP